MIWPRDTPNLAALASAIAAAAVLPSPTESPATSSKSPSLTITVDYFQTISILYHQEAANTYSGPIVSPTYPAQALSGAEIINTTHIQTLYTYFRYWDVLAYYTTSSLESSGPTLAAKQFPLASVPTVTAPTVIETSDTTRTSSLTVQATFCPTRNVTNMLTEAKYCSLVACPDPAATSTGTAFVTMTPISTARFGPLTTTAIENVDPVTTLCPLPNKPDKSRSCTYAKTDYATVQSACLCSTRSVGEDQIISSDWWAACGRPSATLPTA